MTRKEYDQIIDAFELIVNYPEGMRESHWGTYSQVDATPADLLWDLALSYVNSAAGPEDEEGSDVRVEMEIVDREGERVNPFSRKVLKYFAGKEAN
jgi:hypothetical protein